MPPPLPPTTTINCLCSLLSSTQPAAVLANTNTVFTLTSHHRQRPSGHDVVYKLGAHNGHDTVRFALKGQSRYHSNWGHTTVTTDTVRFTLKGQSPPDQVYKLGHTTVTTQSDSR